MTISYGTRVMKIIFLDFDGVVVTQRTKFNSVDPECMGLLSELVWSRDAHIVVTSTWRIAKSLEFLKGVLGRSVSSRVIGKTGHLDHRGKEIQQWLEENKDKNIESIVVLDDDVFDLAPFHDFQVRTDTMNGMNEEHLKKAKEMLDKPFSL